MKPTVFVGSSTESKDVQDALVVNMSEYFGVRPWDTSIPPGRTVLDVLKEQLSSVHAAVLIFTQDDERNSRGEHAKVARDNVILEYGFLCQSPWNGARLDTERRGSRDSFRPPGSHDPALSPRPIHTRGSAPRLRSKDAPGMGKYSAVVYWIARGNLRRHSWISRHASATAPGAGRHRDESAAL